MEFVNLSNICDVYSGYAFKNFNDKKEGKPVIKIRNIKIDGTINKFDCSYTNEVPLEKFYSQKEDLYIALSGATTGKVGIMDEEGYLINQRVGVIRKKDINVPINYIKVFLDSITGKILKDAVGAAQPNISPKDILKYKFPLRRYDEMVKISNIFTNINNKINICKKYILNLDDIVKSQFIEMFGDISQAEFKFKKIKLSEVCVKKSSNLQINKLEKNFGEYPLYGASGLVKNIDFYISDKDYLGVVKDGSGAGKIFYLEKKSSIVGTMEYVYPKDNVTIRFLESSMNQLNIADSIAGIAIPHIYFKDYSEKYISLPPLELQIEFENFVQLIDKSKYIILSYLITQTE